MAQSSSAIRSAKTSGCSLASKSHRGIDWQHDTAATFAAT
jgi:hypothetical protein